METEAGLGDCYAHSKNYMFYKFLLFCTLKKIKNLIFPGPIENCLVGKQFLMKMCGRMKCIIVLLLFGKLNLNLFI